MIDTGKYEGHTEAPWELNPDDWVWAEHLFMQGNTTNFGNAMLITDAPLLLAEVLRLREDNEKLHDAINGCAYRGSEGSALDLYCESIIERCPTCYQNIDDMECGCEEE